MRYFTFRKAALAHRLAGQVLRFTAGKGYWLFGKPRAKQITMYDSIDPGQIPANAAAVAGYVGGHWPTFGTLIAEWPAKTHKLSIAVNAHEDAECLDVERGDATIDQTPEWVRRQLGRGVKRPVVYTSVSEAAMLLRALERAGINRNQIRLWTAHYTFKPHRCSASCGFGSFQADATQYSDHALGKNLDASLCAPGFFS